MSFAISKVIFVASRRLTAPSRAALRLQGHMMHPKAPSLRMIQSRQYVSFKKKGKDELRVRTSAAGNLSSKFSSFRIFQSIPRVYYAREPAAPVRRIDTLRDDIAEKLRLSRTIDGRRELGKFVIEGEENIRAAIEAGVQISAVAVREDIWDQGSVNIALKTPGSILIISERIMKHIFSSGVLPEIVALADELHPNFKALSAFSEMQRVLIIENIVNPRNLGALLHVAEAFGIEGVLVITDQKTEKGSPADLLLSRHSLNSSLGAIFRIPTLTTTREEVLEFTNQAKFNCIALDQRSPLTLDVVPPDAVSLIDSLDSTIHKKKKKATSKGKKKTTTKVTKSEKKTKAATKPVEGSSDAAEGHVSHKIAIIIGNETAGVSKELTAAAVANISIPTRVPALNVNVSAGIMFNHLFGQRDATMMRQLDADEIL